MKKENEKVEFKTNWRDECMKTLCAFANTDGGKLIIGMNDSGKPVGVNRADRLLEDIPNKVRNYLGIIPQVSLLSESGKELIVVEVHPSESSISFKGSFYVRSGSTTQELTGRELESFLLARCGRTWDAQTISDASVDDLDESTIERFRLLSDKRLPFASRTEGSIDLLRKLNLVTDGRLKRAAILLFGKEPRRFFPGAFLKIGAFTNDTNLIRTDDVDGNLFVQVEEALSLLRTKYIFSSVSYDGIYRKDEMVYPEKALREAITNAVVHRDYSAYHTQIKVFPDRLVLWNNGGLPNGISIEDLLKNHVSQPRNELLADVFFKAGLIETWGRGTVLMIEECRAHKLPDPIFREESGGFSVSLFNSSYISELQIPGLTPRQKKIVGFVIKNGSITNEQCRELTEVSKATATRDLADLVKKGVLDQKGSSRKTSYYTMMSRDES
ncbi:MAG: ATP-binding protein [Mesotoga sp.]|uniref:ATP-binding protein n=1 Tax=unclassified Mesotoga TaxID=1184398 RepID=UPI000FF0A2E4|nr:MULTISPECIES: ATP-binding protein [unclassified Mesotoga]MDI9366756.1 ATP-binding protein [Thermotogota bacterium]MDD2334499.1 ATP-binding protein [Mesotoga sp.]MDD4208260.1 ATP-binding protein [Mesotoga sp.]MDD4826776.1 ATP-binding protein [Mesotoga sp.]MDD5683658.1 ATP-binding protein [Mesotoga sp.]